MEQKGRREKPKKKRRKEAKKKEKRIKRKPKMWRCAATGLVGPGEPRPLVCVCCF